MLGFCFVTIVKELCHPERSEGSLMSSLV